MGRINRPFNGVRDQINTTRREYIRTGGAALAGVGIGMREVSSITAASTKQEGIKFDNISNIVNDYGADNSGKDPIDDALLAAMDDNTLIKFPEGRYKISDEIVDGNYQTIGFTGEGSVEIVPEDGFNNRVLNLFNVDELLFEGIDIDISASGTTAGLRFDTNDRFVVQDVEYIGRGTHPNSDWTVNAFYLIVTNPDGQGILRNVKAAKGSAVGRFKEGNGRSAVWVGGDNEGTIRIENCHFEEFGNNACYASKTPGDVHITDSVFRNNNISSVRIGSKGSYVENTTVEVDMEKYSGPAHGMNTDCNIRGIVAEQGHLDQPGGTEIRNCSVILSNVELSQGGIVGWSTAKKVRVHNTDIRVDADDVLAINTDDTCLELDTVTIKGGSNGGKTVRLYNCDGSSIEGCCILQDGSDRDGIHLVNTDDSTIKQSTINVTGEAIIDDGNNNQTSNISTDDACQNSYDEQTIAIETTGDGVHYRCTATESIENDPNTGTLNSGDEISGSTVEGSVYGGTDGYLFTGEISDFEVTHGDPSDLAVTINGNEKTIRNLLTNETLAIETTGDGIHYEFTVSDSVVKDPWTGSRQSADKISGNTVEGSVYGGVDGFLFTGDVTSFEVTHGDPDDLHLTINGSTVNISNL